MKLLLSPTKTMVFDAPPSDTGGAGPGIPRFEKEALELIRELGRLDPKGIERLFKTSPALTQKTEGQIRAFERTAPGEALFAFRGEAFKTLAPAEFSPKQLEFARDHLFIFSGLYGILSPLDGIRPYRLDLSTGFKHKGRGLKLFWKERVTAFLKERLEPGELLVNLASDEYASLVKGCSLEKQMITLQFRQRENQKLRNLAVRAKQARGIFARAVIENFIQSPEKLKKISPGGYVYAPSLSSPLEWFFIC